MIEIEQQKTIPTWRQCPVESDGSALRETLLEQRGRSHGYCMLTGISLSLSDRILRVGNDRYVAADIALHGFDDEQSLARFAKQVDAIKDCRVRLAAIGTRIRAIKEELRAATRERDEVRDELRELSESI